MIERMQSLITKHLHDEVRKAGEFNLMVSGGVDSSTLLALAVSEGVEISRLFTVHLPYGKAHDEYEDAVKVVSEFGLLDKLYTIELDEDRFMEVLDNAIKAIGRPIPHYNIFPLYVAFETMQGLGVTDVFVGDGPDESMCGYTRHLIMHNIYGMLDREAFSSYDLMLNKLIQFLDPKEAYANIIGKDVKYVNEIWNDNRTLLDNMCAVDMAIMRPDMMDMSHGLAAHFGIKIHAPYEIEEVDNFMFKLSADDKVSDDYGKYLLRVLGSELGVPEEIIWRLRKIGGPVVPVNSIVKNWNHLDPFDKSAYLNYQREVLKNEK